MEALIVIGTSLQTGMARNIVYSAIRRDNIPVLEINPEPCINEGFVCHLAEKSEEVLPKLAVDLF